MGNLLIKIKPKFNLIYNLNREITTYYMVDYNTIHRFL